MRQAAFVAVAAGLFGAACSSSGDEAVTEVAAAEEVAPDPQPVETYRVAPTEGPVTITADADFSGEQIVGTFRVTEGDDILGCMSGTFSDIGTPLGVDRTMTCEAGPRAGTIDIRFVPGDDPGPGDQNGPWEVRSAGGDFAGLTGGGDFSVTFDPDEPKGNETLTGEIAYGEITTAYDIPAVTVPRLHQPGGGCFDGFGTTDGLEEYATVGNELQRLTIASGDVTSHGPPPAECALWLGDEQAGRRMATSPDAMTLWFGPFDGAWETEKQLDEPLFLMSRSFGANRLVFVSNDGESIVMLDATTGEQVGEPIEASFADGRSFSATAANVDGTLVAVGAAIPPGGGHEGRVFISDAASGLVQREIDVATPVTAMVFAPSHDGSSEELVVAGLEGMMTTIDVVTGEVVAEVQTTTPDDAVLATGTRSDGLVVVFSERAAELVDRRSGPTGSSIELEPRDAGRIRPDGAVVTIAGGFTYEIFDGLAEG